MKIERIEKKFIYLNGDISYFYFLISGMFIKTFSERTVNSFYFDTENYKDVWDNINGYSDRKKIRLRWYDDLKNSEVFIEKKEKKNFITHKEVSKIGNFGNFNLLNKFINSQDFKKYDLKYSNNNLKKTILVEYKRNYYELPNKKLRVTVDNNIKIFYNYPLGFINLDKTIVELKYDLKNSSYVNLFVKENKLLNRNRKFSKYVNSFLELTNNAFI
jgi:hypothetical protein